MKAATCALLALLLAGCFKTVDVQRVEIPVPVPCIEQSAIPGEPRDRFGELPRAAPMDDSVRALLQDRESGRSYSRKLRAIVEASVIP